MIPGGGAIAPIVLDMVNEGVNQGWFGQERMLCKSKGPQDLSSIFIGTGELSVEPTPTCGVATQCVFAQRSSRKRIEVSIAA